MIFLSCPIYLIDRENSHKIGVGHTIYRLCRHLICETLATSVFMHLSVHRINLNINLNKHLSSLPHGKQFSLQLARMPGTTGRSVNVFLPIDCPQMLRGLVYQYSYLYRATRNTLGSAYSTSCTITPTLTVVHDLRY